MLPDGNKITDLHIAVLDDRCGDADAREKLRVAIGGGGACPGYPRPVWWIRS